MFKQSKKLAIFFVKLSNHILQDLFPFVHLSFGYSLDHNFVSYFHQNIIGCCWSQHEHSNDSLKQYKFAGTATYKCIIIVVNVSLIFALKVTFGLCAQWIVPYQAQASCAPCSIHFGLATLPDNALAAFLLYTAISQCPSCLMLSSSPHVTATFDSTSYRYANKNDFLTRALKYFLVCLLLSNPL